MKLLHLLLAGALCAAVLPAAAQRLPVPIVNHENVMVERAPGRGPVTAQEVRKAIEAAAVATGRQWSLGEPEPGRLIATYHVRTHTVITEIRYTGSHFSVAYRDSVNMKHGPGPDGKGVIHPFYNQWVQEFIRAIQTELRKA